MTRDPSRPARLRPLAATCAVTVAALGLGALPAGANPHADGSVTLDILGITDFHGALAQAPALAGQVDALRAANPDTVLVSVGDNIGGSTYASAIQQDTPTIDVLNAMGLEASAVGNHEFDRGYADLAGRVADRAHWAYLGANVEGESPDLAPTHVWTSPSGVTVGFVGAVTDATAELVSAAGIAGISFTDEVAAVNAAAADLSDGDEANGEADVVVALVHEGATDALVTGLGGDVDALFTGHTHAVVDLDDRDIPVIQGGASGANLSRVSLTYDPTTDAVVGASSANIAIDAKSPVRDAEVQGIVDRALADAAVLGRQPVGTVAGAFDRATNSGADTGANRGAESPLGNLLGEVAQATAAAIGLEADFGIINPGGIRADLDADDDGTVTYQEAFDVQPFGNTIGTIDLTGAQVVTMLEQQFQPGASRPVLRLGLSDELEYVYDPTAAHGEHITAVYVDGAPLDPAATYTVASNTFLLGGQDGFEVFTEGTNLTETGIVDVQGLIDYLAAHPGLVPDLAQRSVGVTSRGALTADAPATLELSSLAFTASEPAPPTVSVSLDGSVLATAPVDATVTPNTDETGTATVTFTLPKKLAAGFDDLVITTDAGTAIAYPAAVDGRIPPGHRVEHPGQGNVPDHVRTRWAERAAR
ncbi:bifunctional metallophosphatase/5'-nucleotidase [Georgenia thermotolerans]|uniref:Bifunctional metallophosphatase/5'-nucleotidase n=1 Tax=Georgenia thermotolerans TaxID=527326 RepID=A0A7J5UQD3_9MICO|nr:5'-nucleotidase C-terminal domain-containing protein [Georgenia thermotolerans]KAE8764622.1 bifunctional metallophosphatase/5'-nucleotidase [Georgenia thermotolerans]